FFGVRVPVTFFEFCLSLFKEDALYYFLVIFLFNTVIAYTILVTGIKLIDQYLLSRKFRTRILSLRNEEFTKGINRHFHRQNQDILVIEQKQSLAFTMGFWKPVIVLSTGLIEMLD